MHFAPEPIFRDLFLRSESNYYDADLKSNLARYKVDITNINFNNNFFDYIFCTHVLEHVLDDKKAMSELYGVLKPGGTAYLCVPLTDNFVEDFSIQDEDKRELMYGDKDHVRYYNLDVFTRRLSNAGFDTSMTSHTSDFPAYLEDANLGNSVFVLAKKM